MQPFHISDALRCSLLYSPRGPNLACPRDGSGSVWLRQNATLWKQALTQRQDRIMLGWWNGLRLGGLISARTRAGGRVWEVDQLYLSTINPQVPDAEVSPVNMGRVLTFNGDTRNSGASGDTRDSGNSLELLERLILAAGDRSAERIFLRLPTDSAVIYLARRAGFFPCYEESLFEGVVCQAPGDEEVPPLNLHSLLPSDEYALFQLFNATTPASVRAALGLTCDQWRDAQAVQGRSGPEWITESKGRIISWLKVPSAKRGEPGKLLVHPDHSDQLAGLLKLAHNCLVTQRWLLADYQESIARHLQERGFQPTARYTMLVKTVAAPVMNPGMVQVGA